MKTINIEDEQHNELIYLANIFDVPMNKMLSILVKKSVDAIPGHSSVFEKYEVDKERFIEAIKYFDIESVPVGLIFKQANRGKHASRITPQECNLALFVMLIEGDLEQDSNLNYSVTETSHTEELI